MSTLTRIVRYAGAVRHHGAHSPKVAARYFMNYYTRPVLHENEALSRAFSRLHLGNREAFTTQAADYLYAAGARLRSEMFPNILNVVQRRANLQLDHDDAADIMQVIVDSESWSQEPTAVLLAAQQLISSVGLFEQGLVLHNLAIKALRRNGEVRTSRRDRYLGVVAALHQDDPDYLVSIASAPNMRRLLSGRTSFGGPLPAYMSLLEDPSGSSMGARTLLGSRQKGWHEYVNSSEVLIYGPSESYGLHTRDFSSFRVVRSLTTGVLRWPVTSDFISGRCNVAYMNSEMTRWFESLTFRQQDEAIKDWDFLVVKGTVPGALLDLPTKTCTLRGADTYKGLFLSGSANMLPIMLVDVLLSKPKTCAVAGMNFFVAGTPYRLAHRGLDDNGRLKDVLGSTGYPFQKCHSLALHNAFENRNIVRNLWQVRDIPGDIDFQSVMRMNNQEYARRLSEIYGRKAA